MASMGQLNQMLGSGRVRVLTAVSCRRFNLITHFARQLAPTDAAVRCRWKPSQETGSQPLSTSRSTLARGVCKHRRCSAGSTTAIGPLLCRNCADGYTAAEKFYLDSSYDGRLRPLCCSATPDPQRRVRAWLNGSSECVAFCRSAIRTRTDASTIRKRLDAPSAGLRRPSG